MGEGEELNYYGARYYDPKTCVWLGVDPLSDKNPNISPFVYCNNNPIIRIDPDGKDDYEVDKKSGEIKFVKATDDKTDRLIAGKARYDKDGNLKNKTTHEVQKGVINNRLEDCVDQDGKTPEYNFTELDFKEDTKGAIETHKWLSDNTHVEWSATSITEEGKKQNWLTTSHNGETDYRGSWLAGNYGKGGELSLFIHNHPGISSGRASDEDKAVMNNTIKYSPKALFLIYKMNRYRDYNFKKVNP